MVPSVYEKRPYTSEMMPYSPIHFNPNLRSAKDVKLPISPTVVRPSTNLKPLVQHRLNGKVDGIEEVLITRGTWLHKKNNSILIKLEKKKLFD